MNANIIERNVPIPQDSAVILYGIDLFVEDSSFIASRGWSIIAARETLAPEKICILIASAQDITNNFRLCLPKQTRTDLIPLLKQESIRIPVSKDFGFALLFPKELLTPGTYKIGLIVAGTKNWHLTWLMHNISM